MADIGQIRDAYGLGPEAGSGMQEYVRDSTAETRWNAFHRTGYNSGWRCMTPVFNIGRNTLWVGSQPAANGVQRLQTCSINRRLSALGWWGCQQAPGFADMPPFRIDNFLRGSTADVRRWQLQNVIRGIDQSLREGSLLVFCKQGCRRGPTLVGSYLMAKTGCAPGVVFQHLARLRTPVEPRVLKDLRWLHNYCQIPDDDWQVAKLPEAHAARAWPWVPTPPARAVPAPPPEDAEGTALGQAATEPEAGTAAASQDAGASTAAPPDVLWPRRASPSSSSSSGCSSTSTSSSSKSAPEVPRASAPASAEDPSTREAPSRPSSPAAGRNEDLESTPATPVTECSERAESKGDDEEADWGGGTGDASEASSSTRKSAPQKRARFHEDVVETEGSGSRGSRTALGQDVDRLRIEVNELKARRLGEDLFGALSRAHADLREARFILDRRGVGDNFFDVVNYKDVGGMTPLHRAARIAHPEIVRRLMDLRADPNAATFPSRAPGNATPLQCLAEADMSRMDECDMRQTLGLLVEGMNSTALCQQTTKGANFFHLAAARGNLAFVQELVAKLRPRISPNNMMRLLNATNIKGKTVRDLAMYNAKIQAIVAELGGEKAYPKTPDVEFTHVPEWHHWNRRYHMAQQKKNTEHSWDQADSSWDQADSSWPTSSPSWHWSGSAWGGWEW